MGRSRVANNRWDSTVSMGGLRFIVFQPGWDTRSQCFTLRRKMAFRLAQSQSLMTVQRASYPSTHIVPLVAPFHPPRGARLAVYPITLAAAYPLWNFFVTKIGSSKNHWKPAGSLWHSFTLRFVATWLVFDVPSCLIFSFSSVKLKFASVYCISSFHLVCSAVWDFRRNLELPLDRLREETEALYKLAKIVPTLEIQSSTSYQTSTRLSAKNREYRRDRLGENKIMQFVSHRVVKFANRK